MKKSVIFPLLMIFMIFSCNFFVSCGNKAANDTEANANADEDSDKEDLEDEEEDEVPELFISKQGKFKADFMGGRPKQTSEMVPTDAGNIEMFSFVYEKSATEAFMIAYGDYPSALVEGQDPYGLIESARDGALEGSTQEDNEKLKVNGFPATRTYAFNPTNNIYYVYEVILAKNRLYQVMAARDGDYPSDNTVERFVDGFTITMKK